LIDDPLFWLVAVPAVFLAGASKGGFGGGLAFAGILVIATVIPPVQAAAIMLPLLCLMDVVAAWAFRKSWHRPSMAVLVPGSLIGIALGTATFTLLDDQMMRILVGGLAVGFTLDHWIRGNRPPKAQSRPKGLFWGAMAGYTSFVIHAGGPATNIYLLPQRLEKSVFVGTIVIFYLIVNYAKIPSYAWLGLLNGSNLTTAAILAPLAAIGTWIGTRLHAVISEAWVYRLSYLTMFATGLNLLYDGFAPWFRA